MVILFIYFVTVVIIFSVASSKQKARLSKKNEIDKKRVEVLLNKLGEVELVMGNRSNPDLQSILQGKFPWKVAGEVHSLL